MLNVEMLSTGDEVLHGQIVDTNAAWLADFFFNQGLPLTRRHTVGDDLDCAGGDSTRTQRTGGCADRQRRPGADQRRSERAGRGDRQRRRVILHEEWLETMTRFFAERGRPMAESNRKQAEIPPAPR
jgi:molybdopterin-biosynthesis enzyme MoeA-like protein